VFLGDLYHLAVQAPLPTTIAGKGLGLSDSGCDYVGTVAMLFVPYAFAGLDAAHADLVNLALDGAVRNKPGPILVAREYLFSVFGVEVAASADVGRCSGYTGCGQRNHTPLGPGLGVLQHRRGRLRFNGYIFSYLLVLCQVL
jgi:hypothetical protein